MAPKASVDKGTTIRAASRNKQRSQTSNKAAASPFGSSAGGSLASSLSSLFSPQPHGKDAALASLLASSSKPPVNLGQKSGLAAFGSFSSAKPAGSVTAPTSAAAGPSRLFDDKQKDKRKNAAANHDGEAAASSSRSNATASTSKDEASTSAPKVQDQKKASATQHAASAASASKPIVPNVPAGRKAVFRPVLASSTAVSWPEMPVAGSKTVLHTLLELLAQPEVQEAVHRDLGRRTRTPSSEKGKQKNAARTEAESESESVPALAPPQLLAGVNSITRAIEADIATDLEKLHAVDAKEKGKAAANPPTPPSVNVVFVCRHDLPQPSLIAHLPMLVTARNAVIHACRQGDLNSDDGVLLFALPSRSEELLAKALNLRRASIVALTSAFSPTHLAHILAAIERETGSICRLRASWLETAMLAARRFSSTSPLSLTQQPTTIKLLRTTQPVDLNACKAAKKTKRKERSARWTKRKMQMQQRIHSLRAELKDAARKQREVKMKARAEAKKNGGDGGVGGEGQKHIVDRMDTS